MNRDRICVLLGGETIERTFAVVAVISCMLLVGCSGKEEWRGFLYPNRDDLTTHVEIGTFGSLEQCRDAVRANKAYSENADYECGLNCRDELGPGGPLVCKKTER